MRFRRPRRPFGRPGMRRLLRRGLRRGPLAPPPPELEAARADVKRAHEMMAAGDYESAADLFARVAALAAGHQRFRRAGQLYAQAARAALESSNLTLAMSHADRAIAELVRSGDFPHATRVVSRMEEELRARGHEAEAQTLHEKFDARLSERGIATPDIRTGAAAPAPRRELPGQCPACLGPVRPDEVEWIDETSAACSYCGTILKAT